MNKHLYIKLLVRNFVNIRYIFLDNQRERERERERVEILNPRNTICEAEAERQEWEGG